MNSDLETIARELAACLSWLQHLEPRKRFCRFSSHTLKHRIEAWSGQQIEGGNVALALELLRLPTQKIQGSHHVEVGVTRRSLKKIWGKKSPLHST